jgi:hypothetical protein
MDTAFDRVLQHQNDPGRQPDHAQRLAWSMPVREYRPRCAAIWPVLPAVDRAGDLAWGADPVLVIDPAAAPAAAGRPYPDLVATRARRGSLAGSRGLGYLVWVPAGMQPVVCRCLGRAGCGSVMCFASRARRS